MPEKAAIRSVLAASALVLAAGCAASSPPLTWSDLDAGTREQIFLTGSDHGMADCWQGSAARHAAPRAVREVVDSAALVHDLGTLDGGGFVLMSVAVDTTEVRLRPIESDLEDEMVDAVVDRMRPHVRLTDDADRWSGRLRLELTRPPLVRAGHGMDCPPALRDRGQLLALLRQLRRGIPDSAFPVRIDRDGNRRVQPRTVVARFRVRTDGSVSEGRVARSSGDPFIDRLVDRVAPQVRFAPATLDGEAVETWVQIPLTFTR